MPWHESMNALRGAREQVNPNYGFQRQLQNFEHTSLKIVIDSLLYIHQDNIIIYKTKVYLIKKFKFMIFIRKYEL